MKEHYLFCVEVLTLDWPASLEVVYVGVVNRLKSLRAPLQTFTGVTFM